MVTLHAVTLPPGDVSPAGHAVHPLVSEVAPLATTAAYWFAGQFVVRHVDTLPPGE